MTLKQLLRVLNQYDTDLGKHLLGGEAQRHQALNSPSPDVYSQQQHARWMCRQAIVSLKINFAADPAQSKEKAMRWLGFIQGVLWSTGVRSIDEMRADNTSP